MSNEIENHNKEVQYLQNQLDTLMEQLQEQLCEGDKLKFEEVMQFAYDNELNTVWFPIGKEMGVVFGGELFDFFGLQHRFQAKGTESSKWLVSMLESIADYTLEKKTTSYEGGDDSRLIYIAVYKFKKKHKET